MLQEFKIFIAKGNVLELAVGLILATYFGAIVKSLVDHIILPPIGLLLGGIDFSEFKYVLTEATAETVTGAGDATSEVSINYGLFANTVITFLIVAWVVFLVIRSYNKMRERMSKQEKDSPLPPPAPTREEVLLTEIRELLKK